MTALSAKGYLASPTHKFNYRDPAPRATKLSILNAGDVCIIGFWQDDLGHKAWARLPSRDMDEERALGLAA
jgi:hypothetical protein